MTRPELFYGDICTVNYTDVYSVYKYIELVG